MSVETIEKPVKVAEVIAPKWYLCHKCQGSGEVPSDKVRRGFQGVKTIKHGVCPICNGKLIIKTATDKGPGGIPLHPVEQCPTCKNWHAVGGGKPADEPCYQEHYTLRNSVSHCHWHDKSLPHFVINVMAESA